MNKTEIVCPVAKKCSGCQLSNLNYEQQLVFKQNKVNKLLAKYCRPEPITGMEHPYHYRNKAQAVFKINRSKQLVSGVYQSSTTAVVEVENCMLQTEETNRILQTLCRLLKSFKVMPYDNRTGKGYLRSVLVRQGFVSGEIMVILIGATNIFPGKKTFISALVKSHPQIKTIVLSVNRNPEKLLVGSECKTIYGEGTITDELCGLQFLISPKSFYQVNPVQTEVLYEKVMELAQVKPTDTVFDAYCGVGTMGLIAAKQAKKVYGTEINGTAIYDAKQNAKLNKIKNAEFYKADAKEFIQDLVRENITVNVVFADPPRAGCSKEFLQSLVTLQPEKVVYVSCNPETLARDLQFLTKNGYSAKKLYPVDMFPHTNHVECVVLMTRKSG